MKKILTAILALSMLATACACAAPAMTDTEEVREGKNVSLSADAEAVIEAKDVKLDKNHLEMKIGAKETLKATVLPSNADDQTVAWKSGNTSIVTVSENG